jgi:hypothetical protein
MKWLMAALVTAVNAHPMMTHDMNKFSIFDLGVTGSPKLKLA